MTWVTHVCTAPHPDRACESPHPSVAKVRIPTPGVLIARAQCASRQVLPQRLRDEQPGGEIFEDGVAADQLDLRRVSAVQACCRLVPRHRFGARWIFGTPSQDVTSPQAAAALLSLRSKPRRRCSPSWRTCRTGAPSVSEARAMAKTRALAEPSGHRGSACE